MLVMERRIGETLVLKPQVMGETPYRIVVKFQSPIAAPAYSCTPGFEIQCTVPIVQHDVWLETPAGERIRVSLDRVRGGKAKVAIEAPRSVLVLRGEIEKRWRDCG